MSAVPFGPGIDIRRYCRLLGAMLRALCILPGGLGRFLPCNIGANHCSLRHIGWVQSGHGLTSRPRETSDVRFLDELLFLFGYPPGSGCALLRGTLPLRYCTSLKEVERKAKPGPAPVTPRKTQAEMPQRKTARTNKTT